MKTTTPKRGPIELCDFGRNAFSVTRCRRRFGRISASADGRIERRDVVLMCDFIINIVVINSHQIKAVARHGNVAVIDKFSRKAARTYNGVSQSPVVTQSRESDAMWYLPAVTRRRARTIIMIIT